MFTSLKFLSHKHFFALLQTNHAKLRVLFRNFSDFFCRAYIISSIVFQKKWIVVLLPCFFGEEIGFVGKKIPTLPSLQKYLMIPDLWHTKPQRGYTILSQYWLQFGDVFTILWKELKWSRWLFLRLKKKMEQSKRCWKHGNRMASTWNRRLPEEAAKVTKECNWGLWLKTGLNPQNSHSTKYGVTV